MLSPAKEEVGDGETKGVLKKSSKEDLQHPSTQDDDKVRNPSAFQPEWL